MERTTSMSRVYSITAIGFITLSALIASSYVPRGPYSVDTFLRDLQISTYIFSLIGAMTIIAVTALGIGSLINVFELTQDRFIAVSDSIDQRLDEWSGNLDAAKRR